MSVLNSPKTLPIAQCKSCRSMLKRGIGVVGLVTAVLVHLGTPPTSAANQRSEQEQSSETANRLSPERKINGVRLPDGYVPVGYPKPTYLLPDFHPGGAYRGRIGGFGRGEAEICSLYGNYQPGTHVFHQLLSVYVSPKASSPFLGTEGHSYTEVAFTTRDGDAVEAKFYDGKWYVKTWDTRQNVLVFDLRGFHIGLWVTKGDTDVGLSELIKVAQSLKFD